MEGQVPVSEEKTKKDALRELYKDGGRFSSKQARNEYYNKYATDDERVIMDMQDRRSEGFSNFVFGMITGFVLYAIMSFVINFI